MIALVDRHQADLFYSLQLLFARLGVTVYTPLGHEWWDEGYWRFGEVYGDDRLARQFLAIDARWTALGPHCYLTHDPAHPERPIYGLSLTGFREQAFAFVVATVQDNQAGFARLAREVGAKYVYGVGNTSQQVNWSLDPLTLISAEAPIEGRGVRLRQEFDDRTTFRFREPGEADPRRIASFVNCMPSIACWPTLLAYRAVLPEFAFRVHGIDGPDGNLHPVQAIAEAMAGSMFGWHDKEHGDGFGHVLHNWAAVGRPLIGHASHYRGRMGEPLWQDLVTCLDLDQRTDAENVALIRAIAAEPDRHAEMCRAIRRTFDELVDWEGEAAAARQLLET